MSSGHKARNLKGADCHAAGQRPVAPGPWSWTWPGPGMRLQSYQVTLVGLPGHAPALITLRLLLWHWNEPVALRANTLLSGAARPTSSPGAADMPLVGPWPVRLVTGWRGLDRPCLAPHFPTSVVIWRHRGTGRHRPVAGFVSHRVPRGCAQLFLDGVQASQGFCIPGPSHWG